MEIKVKQQKSFQMICTIKLEGNGKKFSTF